jgi:hypothetical protein
MSNSNPVSRIRARTHAQLAEHAAAIRRLNKRTIEDTVETGKHLIAAKELAGHGHWLSWLRQELGWMSESSALRYMHVAEFAKSVSVTDLNIDLAALYHLAAPSTPRSVVEHALALGRRITVEDIATRWVSYEAVEKDAPQVREVHYESQAVNQEPPPARQIRFEVTYERGGVVVPYYRAAPRTEEVPRVAPDDFRGRRIRGNVDMILRSLTTIAATLAEGWDIGEIVEALTDRHLAVMLA